MLVSGVAAIFFLPERRLDMILPALLTAMVFGVPAANEPAPAPGTIGHYATLTCWVDKPPPFASVDFICGPSEKVGDVACTWWQLDLRKSDDAKDRAARSNPCSDLPESVRRFERAGPLRAVSREDSSRGRDSRISQYPHRPALLPGWGGFEANFVPASGPGDPATGGPARYRRAISVTC